MAPVRIATYTKFVLLQEGLHRILGAEPSFIAASGGSDASARAGATRASDVALVDSGMEDALTLCAKLAAHEDGPRVIFVGVADDYEWSMDALRAGARGLVGASVTADALIRAIRAVHQGAMWIPEQLLAASMDRFVPYVRTPHDGIAVRLSAREREVFRHAATGMSNKELAGLLHISEATVKVHLTSIFSKLGVRGRAELAAAYHGILHHTPPVALSR